MLEEKNKFMTSLKKHGRNYARISKDVGTKNYKQISHACSNLRTKLLRSPQDEETSAFLDVLPPPH